MVYMYVSMCVNCMFFAHFHPLMYMYYKITCYYSVWNIVLFIYNVFLILVYTDMYGIMAIFFACSNVYNWVLQILNLWMIIYITMSVVTTTTFFIYLHRGFCWLVCQEIKITISQCEWLNICKQLCFKNQHHYGKFTTLKG